MFYFWRFVLILLATFPWSSIQACDLSKTNSLPKLHLITENHYNRHAVKKRDDLLRLGAKGKLPVASELRKTPGKYDDPSNFPQSAFYPRDHKLAMQEYEGTNDNKVYGIDSPELHSMTNMQLLALDTLGGYEHSVFTVANLTAKDMRNLEYHSAAFQKVKKQAKHKGLVKALAAAQKKFEQSGLPENRRNMEMAIHIDSNSDVSGKKMSSFVLDYHNATVRDYNNRHAARFGAKAKPLTKKRFERLKKECQTNDKVARTYVIDKLKDCLSEKVALQPWLKLRDKEFAKNIKKMLCKNSYDSEAVAIMGSNHAKGVAEILKKMSKGRIKIVRLDATKKDHRSEIDQLISRHSNSMKKEQPTPQTEK